MINRLFALSVTLIALIAIGQLPASAAAPLAEVRRVAATNGARPVPDQYIVVLKEGRDARAVAAIAGVKPKYVYTAALNGFAATLNAGQLTALRQQADVAYIEQDQAVDVGATQFMDGAGDPWGLDRIDQRALPLSRSYTYNATGAGVTAYIIDSGIQSDHPDFGGRAQNVYDALGGNGADCNGHGTHVAGTVGGATWGVAKQVRLRGVRVFPCSGGSDWSTVIAGVDWVRVNAQKPAVANMSLGGGQSSALNTAVTNLINSGVFVAVAAGNNSGVDACTISPASVPAAYTVAASDRNDARAGFSNIGACVDGFAPGVAIKSAWIGSSTNTINGTSMATPHVAGAAALYKGNYGEAGAATITNWLNANATPNVIQNSGANTPNRLLYINLPQNLYGIAKANTGSGKTEVHILNAANNFQSFVKNIATALGTTGADGTWDYALGDYNRDGVQDVYAIRKASTGTGKTEVHVLNGADNFQSFLLHIGTALGTTGADASWVFMVGDYNRDGIQDLYGVAKANTGSGKTEVHVLNGANNFQSFLLHSATALGTTGSNGAWNFVLGDYNRDGILDVYGISKAATGTGKTEVHVLNGANNFQSFLLNTGTALGLSGADASWMFTQSDYNGDGIADLVGIAKANTGSGKTEVHVLNGANNFQSFLLNIGTALGTTGSDGSWDFIQ